MTNLLRLPEVLCRTSLSRSKLYELIEAELFPKPAKQAGGRVNVWRDSDVEEWINAQFADSEQGGGE